MKIAFAPAVALLLAVGIALAAGQKAAPSLDPRYAELDFWLGEWDVFDASGRQVGENSIRKELKGRLVLESWRDAAGGEGKGMHFFDAARGHWKLVWVDDRGGVKEKTGGPAGDAAMRVEGEVTYPGGTRALDRTTLTRLPDGRVRQVIEWSADAGRTWKTSFDATYVRKKG